MDINYKLLAFFTLGVIILVVFLIRRNSKDEKKFEKEIIESDLKPEKHKEDGGDN